MTTLLTLSSEHTPLEERVAAATIIRRIQRARECDCTMECMAVVAIYMFKACQDVQHLADLHRPGASHRSLHTAGHMLLHTLYRIGSLGT